MRPTYGKVWIDACVSARLDSRTRQSVCLPPRDRVVTLRDRVAVLPWDADDAIPDTRPVRFGLPTRGRVAGPGTQPGRCRASAERVALAGTPSPRTVGPLHWLADCPLPAWFADRPKASVPVRPCRRYRSFRLRVAPPGRRPVCGPVALPSRASPDSAPSGSTGGRSPPTVNRPRIRGKRRVPDTARPFPCPDSGPGRGSRCAPAGARTPGRSACRPDAAEPGPALLGAARASDDGQTGERFAGTSGPACGSGDATGRLEASRQAVVRLWITQST